MTAVTATSPLRLGPLAVYSRQIASRLPHIDFVLVALVVLFGGLYLYSPDQAFRTIRYVAGELAHIGPWLAGSVMVAAAAKATGADSLAARAFRGRQSVIASLVGALLPFCSCGVIPLVAGLLGAGVPLAPVMAFWISSPLMDPTTIFHRRRHSRHRLRSREDDLGDRDGNARRVRDDAADPRWLARCCCRTAGHLKRGDQRVQVENRLADCRGSEILLRIECREGCVIGLWIEGFPNGGMAVLVRRHAVSAVFDDGFDDWLVPRALARCRVCNREPDDRVVAGRCGRDMARCRCWPARGATRRRDRHSDLPQQFRRYSVRLGVDWPGNESGNRNGLHAGDERNRVPGDGRGLGLGQTARLRPLPGLRYHRSRDRRICICCRAGPLSLRSYTRAHRELLSTGRSSDAAGGSSTIFALQVRPRK